MTDTNDFSTYPAQSARTRRFTLGLPRAFTVSADGSRVLFLRTRGPEDPTGCLWLLDGDQERLLVDPTHLAVPGDLPDAERVRRERARERTTGIVAYSTDAAVTRAVFTVDGRLWQLDLATDQLRPLATAGPVVDPRLDPSGRRIAYVTDRDLRVLELANSNDHLVAGDSDPEVSWGMAEHAATESMHRTRGHWWSPDGTALLAARVDQTPVQRWWIADAANPDRPPRELRYPAAGTPNALVTLHRFTIGTGDRVELSWDRAAFEYLASVTWDEHGPLLTVQSRDQRTVLTLAADPTTGRTHILHEQHDPAWVELIYGLPARTATGHLVTTDDTPTTRRLLVDGRPVTPEGLQVRAVLDVTGESVLFEAIDEPTELHLWRYDASGLHRLSHEPGRHSAAAAGATLLLAANTDTGRSFTLHTPGRPDRTIRSLVAEPVVTPRITWLRAGDLELRTALLLPSWYERGTTLPVLMAPYGGPALQLAVRGTSSAFTTAQWYAESGFAVVIADGRGTPGRGPSWDKTVFGDTLSAPLADQVTALEAVAQYCPDLDLGRVGITGWSYGGILAAAAVLRRPETFHAAVAGAGPMDQRLYDTHWRERFLGLPEENAAAYDRSSLLGDAPNLTRPLLLVHGLADDNVVSAHSLRLSAALLAAGRPHQVLPIPGATHQVADVATAEGLMRHQLHFLATALGVPLP